VYFIKSEEGSTEIDLYIQMRKIDFTFVSFYSKNYINSLNFTFRKFLLSKRMEFYYYLAQNIDNLNSLGIIHHDIKLQNILINEQFLPLLTDFGFSTFSGMEPSGGTRGYMTYEKRSGIMVKIRTIRVRQQAKSMLSPKLLTFLKL
jgi:serine/threonine protein kinase